MNAEVFLHVLGAITVFGATGAVTVLALAARSRTEQLPLARASFWTLLALALPAWVVMLAFGSWAESTADFPGDPGWLGIGTAIADAGLFVLLLAAFLAFRWMRSAAAGWPVTAIGVLTSLYLVALGVGWWVMSAKVPA
jgi:hypothetical protein